MQNPTSILITGASSGIGAALASEYAAEGVTLFLFGRDEKRLLDVQKNCTQKRAEAQYFVVDVSDKNAMEKAIERCDSQRPIDLLIANAGISGGTLGGGESPEQARRIFDVNVGGVLNSVLPIANIMAARGRGQIALMASLAAMRGLPGAPAYSASKAAVKHYGEALRGSLGSHGVKVSVICPGYIKTPLTDANQFPMPFLMQPEEAARRIRRGLAANQSRIAFPKRLYLPLWLLSCFSPVITDPFFARLPKK